MARTIVLGYDGSECAREALEVAVGLARDATGSTIVVVNGLEVNLSVGGGPMAAELVVPELQDAELPAEAAVSRVLDDATARIAAAGVPVESTIEHKAPFAALLDVAKARNADLIVVGSHGSGAIRGVLLGSTSYKLLHHSTVPVVVVPHRH
jgi:nucleotide-binding universal stress UspA family protein